jgi:hypothetical protein
MEDHEFDAGESRLPTDEELLNDVGGPMPSKYEGRLVLTKMVLENFKSYGGVKEIGPFHSSMSAVVGPNGSGKSNVIDALLFVFGKRASKLRLKKVSELIHKSRWVLGCSVGMARGAHPSNHGFRSKPTAAAPVAATPTSSACFPPERCSAFLFFLLYVLILWPSPARIRVWSTQRCTSTFNAS